VPSTVNGLFGAASVSSAGVVCRGTGPSRTVGLDRIELIERSDS
jgi:hypothetical protein